MLKLKNITTKEKKPYLNNLTFHIKTGEINIMNYKSNIEKDKFIDLICQLETPKSGEVFIQGENITNSKNRLKSIQKKIGISYEEFKFIKSKNVLQNIIFPLEVHTKLSLEKKIQTGQNFLKTFGLLEKENLSLTKLTLEEKQLLNIARSLILNPDFIIFDNPNKHIKENKVEHLINYFLELNKTGKTILIFTNNDKIKKLIQGNTYLLEKGAICNV